MDCIHLVQVNRNKCQVLVNAVMNLKISWKAENILSTIVTLCLLRRTVLHGGNSVIYSVGFKVLTVVTTRSTIIWDVILYSSLQVHWCFRGINCIHPSWVLLAISFLLVTCLVYSSALKLEALCSSQTSVNFCWTIWWHFPEDTILHLQTLSFTYY